MTQSNDTSLPSLDPDNTPTGAMEQAFLTETHTPDNGALYSPEDTLVAMRLMRQVVENRLKNPSEYDARGATTAFGILTASGQFPEFKSTGALTPKQQKKLHDVLEATQSSNSPLYKEYAQYVQLAMQVAHEELNPSTVKWPNVTGWRTKKSGSPGTGFYKIGDFGGNTFFGTIADLAKEPPTAGKLHAIALAPSVMHDLALHQGRPGLGGFAPPPHGQGLAAKPVRHHNAAGETAGHSAHAGANHTSETNTGFRAVLSEAKAQAAQARQEREARQNFTGGGSTNNSFGGDFAEDFGVGGGGGAESTESLRPAPATAHDAAAAALSAMSAPAPGGVSQADIGRALEAYALRISRLPPAGGAAFNMSLSPAWPGLKMPG